MAESIKALEKEIVELRRDVDYIMETLHEENELSEYAEKALEDARNTPVEEYVELK